MRQGAQGWCTGMTLRDGMGRELRGGFRTGETCTPMADSCEYMAKPLNIVTLLPISCLKSPNKMFFSVEGAPAPPCLLIYSFPPSVS